MIANMVDSLDNINKERYLARLSSVKIDVSISIGIFYTHNSASKDIPYTDLENLSLHQ